MTLIEALTVIYERAKITVVMANDHGSNDEIYDGPAGDMKIADAKGYVVKEMYPSCFDLAGINGRGAVISYITIEVERNS